jgi:hypothetical protein
MALPPGTIVVANPSLEDPGGPRGLFAVDPATGRQTTLAQGGMLVEPWNVIFLADGRLLVADKSAFGTGGLIAVDPTSGQQTKVSSSPVFTSPFGMAQRADGQVVVAYTRHQGGPGAMALVDPTNGEHRGVAPDFRFATPFAVAVDAANNIIVTDPNVFAGSENRLLRIDAGVRVSVRDDTEGGIYTGVAVEPTGNLIVISDALATGRQEVLRFHPTSGAPTVLSRGGLIRAPAGVAIEASGAILVVDLPGAVIRVNPVTGAQTAVSTGGILPSARGMAIRR